jgi:hypothetical protein
VFEYLENNHFIAFECVFKEICTCSISKSSSSSKFISYGSKKFSFGSWFSSKITYPVVSRSFSRAIPSFAFLLVISCLAILIFCSCFIFFFSSSRSFLWMSSSLFYLICSIFSITLVLAGFLGLLLEWSFFFGCYWFYLRKDSSSKFWFLEDRLSKSSSEKNGFLDY